MHHHQCNRCHGADVYLCQTGVGAGAVKMRRGLTARVFDEVRTMGDLYRWYLRFLRELADKAACQVDPADPSLKARRKQGA